MFKLSFCEACAYRIIEELECSVVVNSRCGGCNIVSTSHRDHVMPILFVGDVIGRILHGNGVIQGWRFTNDSRRRMISNIRDEYDLF